jgi:calcium uniporter protein, mitochondrial
MDRSEEGGGLHGPENGEPADEEAKEFDSKAPGKSVVFLLHSGQPLR